MVEDAEPNHEALANALADIGAVFDTAHMPPIRPDVARLGSATGALLFRTKHGRLDVLKEAGGETYRTLIHRPARLVGGPTTVEWRAWHRFSESLGAVSADRSQAIQALSPGRLHKMLRG